MTVAEEDAYSLIGIFKLDFRLHYGEGADNALGHLLEEIVARYVWRGQCTCVVRDVIIIQQLSPGF